MKLRYQKTFFFIVLIVATIACNMPYSQNGQDPVAVAYLVTANHDASRTPTPFRPVTSTPRPTYLPSATATKIVAPTNQATGIPTARPKPVSGKYPDGQMRIMVLGSDARPGGGYRTDIIMMVAINPKHGSVSVVSFPRDLYVNIPGWGMNRINTAMQFGGFNMLASTLETNFGVRPDRYIITNFNSFTSIIDSLGGVDVTATQTLTDACKFPIAVKGICTIKPGVIHMNGTMALWYVRSRKTTSDFDRERRSQEVLEAIFKKLFNLNAITRIPELFDLYRKNVETNLTLGDVVGLAPVAPGLISNPGNIRRVSIGPREVYDYVVPENGAQVLIPNEAAIHNILMQAIFTP